LAGALLAAVAGAQDTKKTPKEAEIAALESRLETLLQEIEEARSTNESATESTESAEAAAPPTATIAAFAERVEELDQKVRILERQLEIEREQAKERSSQSPVLRAGGEGFQFRSADGNFVLRFRGYLQADSLFVANEGTDAATSTFLMRRVRPVFETTMFKRFDFKVMPDFGGGVTVLQDGYLDARFSPSFSLRAGKYKSPFGLERLVSATDLLFVERGLPTGFVPNRDVGLMLHGEVAKSRVNYQAGVFNGVVDGGSADVDSGDGKDFVGRVMLHPFRSTTADRWQSLGVGLAASLGTQEGTLTAPQLPNLRRQSRASYFRYRADGTADGTTVADGERKRISPQGYFYTGPFGLLWEYVWSVQDVRRSDTTASIANQSWQLAGSWVLTGESPSYRAVAAKRGFDPTQGTWGAFEITARTGRITIGDEAFPVFANPLTSARAIWTWTAGFNWYLNRSIRIMLNYEEARFEGGSPVGDRALERDLLTRMQFSF
jgi:phosphate-selective porin OprO/OprP